jgi:farnesyl diphosphate synthase
MKTGALITFSAEAACILGDAPLTTRDAIRTYATQLGEAFQIRDDLLDAAGDTAAIGKDAGRDAAAGKATFLTLLGVEGATARLLQLRTDALAALDFAGQEATLLRDLFDHVINRNS